MIDTEWNLALAQPVGPYAGRNLSLSLVAQQHADRESLEWFVPVSYTHLTLPTTPYV